MFQKIVASYSGTPESQRALQSAISLARILGSRLDAVTVIADLPTYAVFAEALDPSVRQVLEDDRGAFYKGLEQRAHALAASEGIELHSHLVEGPEVEAIVEFVQTHGADLLVVGLRQHDLYVARLWSTVYELAQTVRCSVLGVH